MRLYRPLLLLTTLLAFCVVSLGAYVRLSDAGLGCPDWPGCYGQLLGVPEQLHEQSAARLAFPDKPLETHKAWKEVAHRYAAGALGLLILAVAGLAWRYRRRLNQSPLLPTLLLVMVGFQAWLGMWTVTLLLKPLIVTAHLLGGMITLALLLWLLLRQTQTAHGKWWKHERKPFHERYRQRRQQTHASSRLRILGLLAVLTIVGQIGLGGWVSSNYATLACPDFPTCQGVWLPEMDFEQAFQLHRPLGYTASGALLSPIALSTIHWTHRIGALLVLLLLGALTLRLAQRPGWRGWSALLGLTLIGQIALGIANVVLALPLPLALAHNTGAALLLAITVALNFRLWNPAN